jgi:hypothetical protein
MSAPLLARTAFFVGAISIGIAIVRKDLALPGMSGARWARRRRA